MPVAARAEVKLSNLDQSFADLSAVICGSGQGVERAAVGFTTGNDDEGFGYYLDQVSVRFGARNFLDDKDIVVTVHSADGDNPGTELATLAGPDQFTSVGTYAPATPNALRLAASSTYFVQVALAPCNSILSTANIYVTASGTDGGADGWSLADARRVYRNGQWIANASARVPGPLMVSIEAEARGIALSATSTSVGEGSTAAYGVSLASEPTGSVTVAISRRDGGDMHLSVSPSALTFSTSTWNVAQTATVSAASDPDASDGTATFDHDASGGGYDNLSATLAASEADDERRRIELSATSVSVAENGGSTAFAVRLASEPTAAVTVSARAAAPDAAASLSAPLTFAPAHWSVWRTATATGIDDDVDNIGDRRIADFTLSATGGDYGAVSASLRVIAEDDDAAGFAFSPATASVPTGASSSYAVALATRPRSAVTIAISVAASDPASSIVLGSTTRLVFAEDDWNRPRAVVLRDDRSGGALPRQARVEHRASSAGADYDGLAGALRAGGAPTFGDASVPDRNYARGRPIAALVLPQPRFGVGAFSYALSPAPPAGLALDLAARTLSGTPLAAQAAAEYVWSATDEAGATASLAFRIAVTADASGGVGGIDALRFADAVPAQSYLAGRAIAPLTLPTAVGGQAPVRYSLLNVPPGLAFDPATRTLSGTPTEALPARSLVYRATDATGAVATLRFSIAVADNKLPSFGGASVPAQTFAVGRAALLSLPAAAGGDGALTYALSPALPPGLAFDPATRAVSGTPTEEAPPAGYTLTARDENGDAATVAFVIEVAAAPSEQTGEDAFASFLRGWRQSLPVILHFVGAEEEREEN